MFSSSKNANIIQDPNNEINACLNYVDNNKRKWAHFIDNMTRDGNKYIILERFGMYSISQVGWWSCFLLVPIYSVIFYIFMYSRYLRYYSNDVGYS